MTFDPLAPSYDKDFTYTKSATFLRAQVHARLTQNFGAGDHVLELGCGTGEDALYMAQRGIHITATDTSEGMLATARAKVGNNPLVTFAEVDLKNLHSIRLTAKTPTLGTTFSPSKTQEREILEREKEVKFDGAFSNFGPLNVLDDWQPLAKWLSARVKVGGVAAFGVMSPFCLWEMAWHGLHGDFSTASRRLRKKSTFKADSSATAIDIYYPTIRRLTRDFAPYFRRVHVRGLGLFLPPSDVYGVVEKRPRLFNTLLALEKRFAPIPALALFADHYWIEFERVE